MVELVRLAVIHKAARLFVLAGSPLGRAGEITEWGMARILPDREIDELLYGVNDGDGDPVDVDALVVTAEDVIRLGLGGEGGQFTVAAVDDIDKAIVAARHWVKTRLLGVAFA